MPKQLKMASIRCDNLLAEYERWNDSDSATYVIEFKR